MNLKKLIAIIIAVIILAVNLAIIKENFRDFTVNKLNQFTKTKTDITENIISGTNSSTKIAVLGIYDTIELGDKHSQLMNSLENIRNDEDIKGVILNVETPGGGVYESAQISDKIKQIKSERNIPFYTVMGSLAASGGYYVSASTDKIYAMPETMTGSIGVIMSSTNFSGLFEKYGVKTDVIKSGEFKDIGSSTKPMSDQDREIFQKLIDNSYARFVKVVSEGRNMPIETVKMIADGRVYDGQQALELGLVDKMGYYEDALNDMIDALALDDPKIIEYEYTENIDSLLSLLGVSYSNLMKSEMQKSIDAVKNLQTTNQNKPMYLYGGM